MDKPLEVLKQYREQILLAEMAGWLHDIGKFCNLHIESHAIGGTKQWPNRYAYKAIIDNPNQIIRLSSQAANIKKPYIINDILANPSPKAADFIDIVLKTSLKQIVNLPSQPGYTLAGLIMLGMPGFSTHPKRIQLLDGKDGWLPAVLGVCHNEAHHDKQEPGTNEGKQNWPDIFMSTPFGYETYHIRNLDVRLQDLSSNLSDLSKYRDVATKIEKAFSYGLGDTRRPINEITLSSWSSTVAALFKSAIVTSLFSSPIPKVRQWLSWKDKIIDHDFRWRLLRVNFDVLGLYSKAIKIADLLGYRQAIKEACDAIKQLVEEEYPLGNEVYRDTTGIYFTFPDLELPAELAQEIRCRVQEIEPELTPRIEVGEGKGETATEQLKTILALQRKEALKELAYPVSQENYDPRWQAKWDNIPQGKTAEICPVCQLRPKSEHEEVCGHCKNRQESRVHEWLDGKYSTIWLDEVSDQNARVALLVGEFGLDDWLSGDLVQTLLVRTKEDDPDAWRPKNPSPARLRRIWETTQHFWEDVRDEEIPRIVGKCARLTFTAEFVPEQVSSHRVYELNLGSYRLPILYHERQQFLTIERLDYAIKQLNLGSIQELRKKLDGTDCGLEQPGEYGAKRQRVGRLSDIKITGEDEYKPLIPILAEPRTFMALVPADKALEIAKTIKTKYEREMGKVRNRLPLHLGLVFFPRKTPLRTVLEAGRNMLTISSSAEKIWEVEEANEGEVRFTNDVIWKISLTMGDGSPDKWYPFFFVEGNVQDRLWSFQLTEDKVSVSEKYRDRWLVHARYLQKGDEVRIVPSRFDFEFLDTNARRFEVSYRDGKRRAAYKRNRPYLLDDLERLTGLWERIADNLTTVQIKQLDGLIEAKRQQWKQGTGQKEYGKTFKQFVHDVLANVGWKKRPCEGEMEKLELAALTGELHDVLELYMDVLKRKPGGAVKREVKRNHEL